MGLAENSDDHIYSRHKDLCKDLNMDLTTTATAWDSYESIRQHYTLEGDPVHWLGCAIYVACRKTRTPTVGHSGSFVKGNCVSLTRLLRLCNFSLPQFFNKSKKWADMANMPADFRNRIERLERNFAVSFVVFKKYHIIFNKIFQSPIEEHPRQHRSRKQRNVPCTPSQVFEFCWTLFVCIKGEFATCSDDLVTSFHLLLACCDLAFNNAFLGDRRDLLNPNFPGLPANWSSSDYVKPATNLCIIDILCQHFDGVVKEAKWVKEYSWKQAVTKLFEKNFLHGEDSNFSGLLDPSNFDNNVKFVNKVYEEHVLNVGEFDEKIFLDDNLNSTLGSPNRGGIVDEKPTVPSPLENQYDDHVKQLFPSTPLTGRKYLGRGREHQRVAPLTTATQCVIRLQTLLNGRQPEPSEELLKIFSMCTRDLTDAIKKRVEEMGALFLTQYTMQTADQPNVNMDFANKRLALSNTLYYKLLENVVEEERSKNRNLEVTGFLERDVFHQCMFACCIEIVIYSYNSQRKFPWILQALNLKAYYFYRIIELIVRTKDQLSRDVVKHLNSIEEQILESIAWENDSPLWQCIIDSKSPVPNWEDTALPGQLDDGLQPLSNPNIKRIQTPVPLGVQQSPGSSASERFQSPIQGSAKKKIFDPQMVCVKPGQSVLQNKTMAIVVVDDKGNQKYIPISELTDVSNTNSVTASPSGQQHKPESLKPKRGGSLALFFRKFYRLAGVRMLELCNHLNVTEDGLKRKIFTCFEHCIVDNTDLMKDRHLDQILMCAIYVVCKVSKNEKSFTEIMRCYRLQPQSESHVYRSVLIMKRTPEVEVAGISPIIKKDDAVTTTDATTETPTKLSNPSELTGTSTSHESEDRGDLIKFYNTIYIQREQNFALKRIARFSNSHQPENLTLSPLPVTKPLMSSSPKRRVTQNVFVRPYEQSSHSPTSTKPNTYSYYFSRSPSKDLKNINSVISSRIVSKRLLTGDEGDDDVTPLKKSTPGMTRKLQGLIEERLGQTKE